MLVHVFDSSRNSKYRHSDMEHIFVAMGTLVRAVLKCQWLQLYWPPSAVHCAQPQYQKGRNYLTHSASMSSSCFLTKTNDLLKNVAKTLCRIRRFGKFIHKCNVTATLLLNWFFNKLYDSTNQIRDCMVTLTPNKRRQSHITFNVKVLPPSFW